VASQRPFVAISHIGGQEDGNIEIIKEKKLGWVREGVGQSERFLFRYLDDPKKINEKYKKEIEAEAMNNQKSLPMVLERLRQDFL
jgi:hypothetical protein